MVFDPFATGDRAHAEKALEFVRKNRENFNTKNPANPAPLDSHEIIEVAPGVFKIWPKKNPQ